MASKQIGHNEIDMLHGPLFMKILLFALPLAASSVLQQLFNSVDVAVVGRFASSEALAAVGSNAPVINLLINLFVGISMGANAVISNHIGQNDREKIRSAVSTSAVVALLSGVFLMVLGTAVAGPVHRMMGTPVEVTRMAVSYLRIYFLGMPFIMIFNFGSAILRSLGDTRRPLYILIWAGIINTVLNLLFVIVFHMGVEGVAIATGISNLFSAVMVVQILLREQDPYKLHLYDMHIQKDELSHMLEIGVPAGLQGVVFSISNVIIQASINSYGFNAVAGSAAALNFEQYCYYVIAAFNGAAISFVGQNYGAGNMDRVKRIFLICMGVRHSFLCLAQLGVRRMVRLFPRTVHGFPDGEGFRHDQDADRADVPRTGMSLRDPGVSTARHGPVDAPDPADGLRNMCPAHRLGLHRLSGLGRFPCVDVRLSCLLDHHRHNGHDRLPYHIPQNTAEIINGLMLN